MSLGYSPPPEGWQAQPDGVVLVAEIPLPRRGARQGGVVPLSYSTPLWPWKIQQHIPIIFILPLPQGNFAGQTLLQRVGEGVECIEDGDDAGLVFKRGYRDNKFFYF